MYSQHEAKFCFACGEKIEEEVRYCPYCGVDQNRGDNRPQGSSLKEQNTHKKSEPRNSQVNTMKPKPEPIRKNAAEPEVKIEPEPTYGYQASGSKPREGHKKEPLQDLSHKITKFVDKLADKIEKGAKKLQKNWEEANADKKSKIQKKNRKIQAKMEKKRMKTQYKIQKKKAKYQEKMEKKRKSHREKARKM